MPHTITTIPHPTTATLLPIYYYYLQQLPVYQSTKSFITIMHAALAIALALGFVCNTNAAAPTYSCFDPPDEGQSNPLGEGMEEVVGAECCEALIDER